MSGRVRAAALANYVEVARAVGLDPWVMLGEVGLPARCVSEPELKIPISAACELLERSAAVSGVEAFGLLMADPEVTSRLSESDLRALFDYNFYLANIGATFDRLGL